MGHVRKLASCLGLLCPGHVNPAGQGPASHCTALSSGELHCLRYSSMHLTAATEQHQEWTVGCSLSSQGSTPPAAPLPCLWASWGSQVPPTHATDTSSLSTPFPSLPQQKNTVLLPSPPGGLARGCAQRLLLLRPLQAGCTASSPGLGLAGNILPA